MIAITTSSSIKVNADGVFRRGVPGERPVLGKPQWVGLIARSFFKIFLSRVYAVEANPHPGPLPFGKGEGEASSVSRRVTVQWPFGHARMLLPLPIRSGEGWGEGFG